MYSKAEKKQMKLDFWTSLEQQLTEKGKAKGRNIAWMNYPTKIKDFYLRIEVEDNCVRLCIDLQFIDDGVREVFYEQLQEFELKLNQAFNGNAIYLKDYEHSNGRTISRVYTELSNVNLLNKNNWEEMHGFLIENFLKLDDFWVEFSDVFHNLK